MTTRGSHFTYRNPQDARGADTPNCSDLLDELDVALTRLTDELARGLDLPTVGGRREA